MKFKQRGVHCRGTGGRVSDIIQISAREYDHSFSSVSILVLDMVFTDFKYYLPILFYY